MRPHPHTIFKVIILIVVKANHYAILSLLIVPLTPTCQWRIDLRGRDSSWVQFLFLIN